MLVLALAAAALRPGTTKKRAVQDKWLLSVFFLIDAVAALALEASSNVVRHVFIDMAHASQILKQSEVLWLVGW